MVKFRRPEYWTALSPILRAITWMFEVEYQIDQLEIHKQNVEKQVPEKLVQLERTAQQLMDEVQQLKGQVQQLQQQQVHLQTKMPPAAPALDNGPCRHGGIHYFIYKKDDDNLMSYMKHAAGNFDHDERWSICQSLGALFLMKDKALYDALAKRSVSITRQGKAHKRVLILCLHAL